jgi:hypothetical protein
MRGQKIDEAHVKKKVKEILKELHIWYFMPSASRFGKAGVPDFICCKNGHFIGIETKCGSNKATDLQIATMEKIQNAGGVTMIVNEHNLDLAREWLCDL